GKLMSKKAKYATNAAPKGKRGKEWQREAAEKFHSATSELWGHPLFAPLVSAIQISRAETKSNLCPPDGWAVVTNNGVIHANAFRMAEPEEWEYILAHCALHLAFDHFQEKFDTLRWNVACDRVIARFLQEFKYGTPPEEMKEPIDVGTRDEEKL